MNKTYLFRNLFSFLIISQIYFCSNGQSQNQNDLKIWYGHPALSWNEALPIGNGRLGAMVFGGIQSERIQLNESSVWTGKPEDFVNPRSKQSLPEIRQLLFDGKYAEAQKLAQETMMGNKRTWTRYQTLGDLNIKWDTTLSDLGNYERSLDLEKAISKVSFEANRAFYTREIFSSAPDQAIVLRFAANKPGLQTFTLNLSRPGDKAEISVKDNEIVMSEHVDNGNGVKLVARLRATVDGGTWFVNGLSLSFKNANSVTLLITAATDYRGENPTTKTADQVKAFEGKKYEEIVTAHVADYQKFFKRVDLDFGTSDALFYPTDARIKAFQKGAQDPKLLKLYYQYGRYLLICSSRTPGLPANLQGIWADGLNPPWDADFHININIQMNYWLAEVANLSEMHKPFLDFLGELQSDARKTAKDMYGMEGAVAHFTTDAWHFTETYGQPQWAMWPMGYAWSCQHLWEHYLFTEDKTFLKTKAYPLMKDAALFCMNYLIENPKTKMLVSGPSISPENTFKTKTGEIATMVMGPAMDHMIIRDLLNNTINASKVLNMDAAFRSKMEKTLTRLSPTKIGSDGRIMEWTEEFEEPEPGHRHISHLFGLHPGKEITKQNNPELMEAARKTIDYRLSHGGGHTGWSKAWIINFFARLQDGEAAYENLTSLIKKSTLPNLFDNHPPFQIDGNFGAPAGITEMLMQSHAAEIHLLPALPSAWKKGYIHGICARGGFEVDIDWEDGRLKNVKILSKLGNTCQIRYGAITITLKTEKGKEYTLNGELKQ
jgi:alpha-L-fucosidase 2